MKTVYGIMALAMFSVFVSCVAHADRYIESRDTKKSAYYTGEAAGAGLHYRPASSWFDLQKDNVEDIALRYKGFVVQDKTLEEYVIGIGNKLLEHWPGSTPEIHFYIVAQGSPLLYSAGTSAAGEIFISNGVLVQATSEDEIAAIIAHEIAHVLLGHNKKISYTKIANGLAGKAANYYALYKTIDKVSYDQDTGQIQSKTSYEKQLINSAKQRVIAEKLYASSHSTFFSRGAEYDADQLGLDLMMASGYSPQGLKVSLERLAHSYSLTTELSRQLQNVSSQIFQEQTANFTATLNKNSSTEDLEDSMKSMMKNWTDDVESLGLSTLFDFTAKSHPVSEKRVTKITEYMYSNYSRKERRRQLSKKGIEFLHSGRTGKLLENLQAANNAMALISEGQFDEAAPLVLKGISSPSSNAAYNRFVAYRLRESQGNTASALKNLALYEKQSWVPIEESAQIADTYLNASMPREAEALIQQAERYFGTIDRYYPLKIRIASLDNNNSKVKQLGQECLDNTQSAPELAQRCATLAGISHEPKAKSNSLFSGLEDLGIKLK